MKGRIVSLRDNLEGSKGILKVSGSHLHFKSVMISPKTKFSALLDIQYVWRLLNLHNFRASSRDFAIVTNLSCGLFADVENDCLHSLLCRSDGM